MMEKFGEWAKKHWIWLAVAGGLLAVWLLTRTKTSSGYGQVPGLTPSQQAGIAQANLGAQVEQARLNESYQAAQLGAQTQVQLEQIRAASAANQQQGALQAALAQTAAARDVAQSRISAQNYSVQQAAAAYGNERQLQYNLGLTQALPGLIRSFGGFFGGGGGGQVTPEQSFNVPTIDTTPGGGEITNFTYPTTPDFSVAPNPADVSAATGGFAGF